MNDNETIINPSDLATLQQENEQIHGEVDSINQRIDSIADSLDKQSESFLERDIGDTQREAKLAEELQTQEEILQSIDDHLIITNGLIGGTYFMQGMITGILLLKIIWNRIR